MALRYCKKRAAGSLCAGATPAAQMVPMGGVMKLAQKGQRRRGVAKMPRICLLFCR